jgi:YidC/Oxa1 family membrane protein insertase
MQTIRFLIAVLLMIAVMVVTNILLPAPRPPSSAARPERDTAAANAATPRAPVTAPPPQLTADSGSGAAPDSVAAAAAAVPADTVVVETALYRYGFSTMGGALVSAQMLEHPSLTENREGRPAELVPPGAHALLDYNLRLGDRTIELARLSFTPSPANGVRPGQPGSSDTLRFVHNGAELGVELEYTFVPGRYYFEVRGRVRTPGNVTPQLLIGLGPSLAVNEADTTEEARSRGYVVNNPQGDGIRSTLLRNLEGETIEDGPFSWVAIKSKYFAAGVLRAADDSRPFGGAIATPSPTGVDLTVTLSPGADGRFAFRAYAGPQEQDQLAAAADDFKDVNPFGWRWFQPIMRPLGHAITWALYGLHDIFQLSYGWVLVLFGIIVRLLLWPLNAKAMRSQMKNMEIQPKLKEIQARYKNEPEKLQKEMLRLYREENFRPMSGCLPMLAPMPILLTLFFVFQNTIAFRGVSFLWLPDLSRADPLYILPVLLGISMFGISWFSMRTTPQDNPQAKMMMYFMPIFMTVIFLNFASGLNLYYAAQNIASIPQQLMLNAERKRYMAQKKS